MSTSIVEFPLSSVRSHEGIISEPIIPVGVLTPIGFRLFNFLVDSGADFSLLPQGMAEVIGINIKKCPKSITRGVEGRGLRIYFTSMIIRIGPWKGRIRCAFSENDRIPPLLGRLDIFSAFNITFHSRKQSIIFERVRKKGAIFE